MAKYIAKRVALAIVTLLVLTSVVFVLVRLMPGDPFSSDKMTPEIKANLEAYYGAIKDRVCYSPYYQDKKKTVINPLNVKVNILEMMGYNGT